MPFNGAGVFTRVYNWAQDALAGIDILPARMDADANDIATALSNCVTRNGQSPATANIPMGGYKLTGLAPGTIPTDSASYGQILGITVQSVAAVRSLLKTGVPWAFALGWGAQGDGGGGAYFLNGADTSSPDNGGSILVAADGGRWYLQHGDEVSSAQFGDVGGGTTDTSANIQAACTYMASIGGGRVRVSIAKLNTGLTLDTNKVQLVGDGSVWDFSGLTAGTYALTIIQSVTDINQRARFNKAHPITGIQFQGPIGVSTVYGALIQDTVNNTICGVTFKDCAFVGFIYDVSLLAGAFFTSFENCDFTSDTPGHISQTNVYIPAATNAGERNTFTNCRFGIVSTVNFSQSNGNATTSLVNCSFNYAPRMGTISAGTLIITGGSHIEFSSDLDWMFYLGAGGGNPSVIITSTTFAIAASKTAKAFAYVDASVNTTGLTIRDCVFASTYVQSVAWADGLGRVIVSNVSRFTSTGYMFAPAAGSNGLAYGDFESAGFTAEFALLGSTPPARSTTIAKQGTNSLRFQGIAGQTNYANVSVPCTVGQTINYSFWYNGSGITGTGTTFQAQVQYLDATGSVITQVTAFTITTTPAGWVLVTPIASFVPAPSGTKLAQLQIIIQGTTSGTPLGYIDVVNMVAQ